MVVMARDCEDGEVQGRINGRINGGSSFRLTQDEAVLTTLLRS